MCVCVCVDPEVIVVILAGSSAMAGLSTVVDGSTELVMLLISCEKWWNKKFKSYSNPPSPINTELIMLLISCEKC